MGGLDVVRERAAVTAPRAQPSAKTNMNPRGNHSKENVWVSCSVRNISSIILSAEPVPTTKNCLTRQEPFFKLLFEVSSHHATVPIANFQPF